MLTRKTKIISKPKVTDDEKKTYATLFGGKIKTIVHLPRKVKDAKGGTVALKEEKKVVFEYPLMDYILGNAPNDFEIVME